MYMLRTGLVISLVAQCLGQPTPEPIEVSKIFEAQKSRLQKIAGTLNYSGEQKRRNFPIANILDAPEFKDISESARARLTAEEQVITYHFFADQQKHRTDLSIAIDSRVVENVQNLFDGKTTTTFNVDAKIAATKPATESGYYMGLDVALPYLFVRNGAGRVKLADLSSEDTWKNQVIYSEVIGDDIVDGHTCVFVSITDPKNVVQGRIVSYKIAFATDLDYFPLKVEMYADDELIERTSSFDVRSVKNSKGDEVLVPAKCLKENWNWFDTGKLMARTESIIDIDTFQFQEPIPADIFAFDKSKALLFTDYSDMSKSFDLTRQAYSQTTELASELTRDVPNEFAATTQASSAPPISSTSGEAVVAEPSERNLWWYGATLLALSVVMMVAIIAMRRRNAS